MAGDIDYLCSNSCLESFWLTKKVWLSIIMMMIYWFLYNNDGATWQKHGQNGSGSHQERKWWWQQSMSSKKMLSCKVRRYPSKRLPRSLMTAPTKFKLVEGGNFQKALPTSTYQLLLMCGWHILPLCIELEKDPTRF